MFTITEVQDNIPVPATRHGKASTKWEPFFSSLTVPGKSTRKILFSGTDPKDHDKLLNNVRQAKTAFVKKHGSQLNFVIRVVRSNPDLGDADVERDGSGVRVWRGIDLPVTETVQE